jgi:hypothetical protein
MLAAVNAANAAAVAAANTWRSIKFPLALIADVSELVLSTFPAGVVSFSVADIMPTVVLAPTAEFAWPEAVAADVSISLVAAYYTLGVTTRQRPLMSLSQLRHLPIFLQQRQWPLISLSLLILWHHLLWELQ